MKLALMGVNTSNKVKIMTTLLAYLQTLNTAENQWSVWVNPDNVDEYRIGQNCFENGGLLDNWVCIGSLDALSFGYQSTHDAIQHFLKESGGEISYNGKRVKINAKGILDAYDCGNLDEDFQKYLEQEALVIEQLWSEIDAEFFVSNTLPEILENAKLEAEVYA